MMMLLDHPLSSLIRIFSFRSRRAVSRLVRTVVRPPVPAWVGAIPAGARVDVVDDDYVIVIFADSST